MITGPSPLQPASFFGDDLIQFPGINPFTFRQQAVMNAIDKLAADALFIGQCSRCQFPACLLRPHLVLTLAFDAEIEVV